MKRKRPYTIVFFLALIMLFSANVFASNHYVTLDEVGISLDIPEDYKVVTKDTTLDQIKSMYETNSAEKLYSYLQSEGVYLDAIEKNGEKQFVVTMYAAKENADNFQDLSEEELKSYTYSLAKTFEEEFEVLDYYAYQQSQNNFIILHLNDESGEHWQSFTAIDGKSIQFVLHLFDVPDTAAEAVLQSIIDSVEFLNVDTPAVEDQPTVTEEKTIVENTKQASPSEKKLPYKYMFLIFCIALILTIIFYSGPIIIYRYIILKHPIEPKKAQIITIVYGIFAFALVSALSFLIAGTASAGYAIVLWSYVNYAMLTKGKKKED